LAAAAGVGLVRGMRRRRRAGAAQAAEAELLSLFNSLRRLFPRQKLSLWGLEALEAHLRQQTQQTVLMAQMGSIRHLDLSFLPGSGQMATAEQALVHQAKGLRAAQPQWIQLLEPKEDREPQLMELRDPPQVSHRHQAAAAAPGRRPAARQLSLEVLEVLSAHRPQKRLELFTPIFWAAPLEHLVAQAAMGLMRIFAIAK
jgi:hypothetical protein